MENSQTQQEEPQKSTQELQEERRTTHQRIIRVLWICLGLGVLSVFLLFLILSFSDLPDTQELENPRSQIASEIYAANEDVLGRYFIENRVPLSFDEISPYVVQALLATEDERYYRHSGIDLEALGRVLVKTAILRRKTTGGGSTITQQLAKLLFTGTPASGVDRVIQKLKEWIIAVQLERKYTKEEIIAMYLNKFDFLFDGDGIKAASEVYFGRSQDSLRMEEAAVLVGMLKNPSLFNPHYKRRRDTTLHRRMVVLKQMQKNNLIDQEKYDSLRKLPMRDTLIRKTHIDGLAPYFRNELSKRISSILSDEENRKPDGSKYDLYRDGLRIYTTIDPEIQRLMEEAAMVHMTKIQKVFNRHWGVRKQSPWDFKDADTTPGELKARERKLTRMVRDSDRYKNVRKNFLNSVLDKIKKEVPEARLRDVDIDRMLSEEEKGSVLRKLVRQEMISQSMADNYMKVMASEHWPKLKDRWEKLQTTIEKMFEQPVRMRVFTFENANYEKDTTMSPLDSLIYHHGFLQIGSLAVDPTSGHVKGWLGGINYKYFKYDHVTSRRQVGSTFKPFIYATAISLQGVSPCYKVPDRPTSIFPGEGNFNLGETWTPSNSDGEYTGELLTLKNGLRQSKNTVSVFLMKQLGTTEPVRDLVDRMGISKFERYPNGRYVVPKSPSICLGATDLSVIEMTGAYTTFANNGIYNRPRFITRIEDRNGRVIYEETSDDQMALNEKANFVMVDMLKYAGTGLGMLKSEVGGKTGTTNDHVDGWFMGVTPNLVVGTWVGGEDRWIRFLSLLYGQGSFMAKPFYREFMTRLEASEEIGFDTDARFAVPRGELGIELDCSQYEEVLDPTQTEQGGEDPFGEDMFGDEWQFAPDSTNTIPDGGR